MKRTRDIVSVDFTGEPDLKKHVLEVSSKKNYNNLSKYIRDVLKFHTKYKEKINV